MTKIVRRSNFPMLRAYSGTNTTERQAETYIYLAADPDVAEVTGGYWDENNRQVKPDQNSYKIETWDRLWNMSAKLARLEGKT